MCVCSWIAEKTEDEKKAEDKEKPDPSRASGLSLKPVSRQKIRVQPQPKPRGSAVAPSLRPKLNLKPGGSAAGSSVAPNVRPKPERIVRPNPKPKR